jgi:hypothetical protein
MFRTIMMVLKRVISLRVPVKWPLIVYCPLGKGGANELCKYARSMVICAKGVRGGNKWASRGLLATIAECVSIMREWSCRTREEREDKSTTLLFMTIGLT